MSIPQSTIYVCENVRLNSRYEHTIYFADRTAQHNYFAGKVVKTFSAYSFIRKTWDLNVAASVEEAASWSYLYFTNSANAKRYYYFIDNIEYVNDGTVRLKLQIDVLQTYLFDFDLLPCFVERQHTATDAIGDNTIEEGLDVGELTVNGVQHIGDYPLCIMVMCSINPNSQDKTAAETKALPFMYNGVYSGVKIWAVNPLKWQEWGQQIEKLEELGVVDSILAMWMYPQSMVKLAGEAYWDDPEIRDIALPVQAAFSIDDSNATWGLNAPPTTVNGYEPKNKKLLCYPYCLAYATDNQGGGAVYRYERFKDRNGAFLLSGSLSPDGGMHMTPKNYNGVALNYNEGMTITGYPTCAWDTDTYKLWLAQNQHQLRNNSLGAGLKIAAGAAMVVGSVAASATGAGAIPGVGGIAAGAGMVASGVSGIMGQIAQKHDRDVEPPQARGNFSSSVNITNGEQCFTVYHKSCTAETARIIDDFFTMYGYKINRVQTPDFHTRKSHTYVKTSGCHIDANLCNEDATKIEAIFDSGITFWTNGDRIGQYTDDNSVL